MSPAPTWYHQVISRNIQFLLLKHLESHHQGELLAAPFDVFLTPQDAYQPDILFVSQPNLGILTEKGAEGAPDLVVEILSPSSAQLDRHSKRTVYAQAGVRELWIVDPAVKTIEVYRLSRDAESPSDTFGEGDIFESEFFPGLAIRVREIFKR